MKRTGLTVSLGLALCLAGSVALAGDHAAGAEKLKLVSVANSPDPYSPVVAGNLAIQGAFEARPTDAGGGNAKNEKSSAVRVTVTIANEAGVVVRELADEVAFEFPEKLPANQYHVVACVVEWDGKDARGTLVPDGSYTYTVQGTLIRIDILGNGKKQEHLVGTSGALSAAVAVDSASPQITDMVPLAGTYVTEKKPKISAVFSDDAGVDEARTEVKLDEKVVTPDQLSDAGFEHTPKVDLAEDDHTVEVTICDLAGNSDSESATWKVDTVPPDITNLLPADGTVVLDTQPELSAEFADAVSKVNPASLQVTLTREGQPVLLEMLDSGTWGFTARPVEPQLPDGFMLEVSIADNAGNVSQDSTAFTVLHEPVYEVGPGEEFDSPQDAMNMLVAVAQANEGVLPEDSTIQIGAGTYEVPAGAVLTLPLGSFDTDGKTIAVVGAPEGTVFLVPAEGAGVVVTGDFDGRVVVEGIGFQGSSGTGFVVDDTTFFPGGELEIINSWYTDLDYGIEVKLNAAGDMIKVTNCTIYGGTNGIFNNSDIPITVTNCILWGASGDELVALGPAPFTVTYSDVQGGYSGAGNIDSDPFFVNAAVSNFQLLPGSPCIDAADGDAAPQMDKAGKDRHDYYRSGDPGTPNTGIGAYKWEDMGPYEFWGYSPRVTIQSPNGGETWEAAKRHTMSWGMSLPYAFLRSENIYTVTIEVSRNGGSTWDTIDDNVWNVGQYRWLATGPDTGDCLIRVTPVGFPKCGDVSNGTFTIAPGIWRVKQGAPGPHDGISWNRAFGTIQEAMNQAHSGDQIWVAGGGAVEYDGPLQMKEGVAVYGGFAGTEMSLDERDFRLTTLSGGTHVVEGASGARLDGFTIRNGNARQTGSDACGGGLYNDGVDDLVVANCSFMDNGARIGGGLYADDSSIEVTNCVFVGNTADTNGGGIYSSHGSSVTLTNCSFYDNSAEYGGAVWNDGGLVSSTVTIVNSILWGDTATQGGAEIYNSGGGQVTVTYSDVQGGYADDGNIDADPLYTGTVNLRLQSGSPCIDAADGDAAPLLDKEGIRRYDDPYAANSGTGEAIFVDMGAYEFRYAGRKIIYVDADAPALAHDGKTWATAYQHPQHAASVSLTGDEIWVAEGTYVPLAGAMVVLELEGGVNVYGGFEGTEFSLAERGNVAEHPTVLDGEGAAYHVIVGASNVIIDSFTIRGGNADGEFPDYFGGGMFNSAVSNLVIRNCTFISNWAYLGGGIYNDSSSPSLENCVFEDNWAYYDGGGMLNESGSSPGVSNCTFTGNWVLDGRGGAICSYWGNLSVVDSTFSDNFVRIWAPYDGGGAIYNGADFLAVIADCLFIRNSANRGGAIDNQGADVSSVANCVFKDNYAAWGGGMNNEWSDPQIANCLFAGNSAIGGGGMCNSWYAAPTVTNCTFSGNSATNGGALHCINYAAPNAVNCILWGDAASSAGPEIHVDSTSSISISHSDIGQSGYAGIAGNIEDDPLFVDADGQDNLPGTSDDDLRLSLGSPCIDTGTDAGIAEDIRGVIRPKGAAHDMGAYESFGLVAIATATPNFGPAPLEVTFDASASQDTTFTCLWSIKRSDDETVEHESDSQSFTYTFVVPGSYTAELTVTTPSSVQDADPVSIYVTGSSDLLASTAWPKLHRDARNSSRALARGPLAATRLWWHEPGQLGTLNGQEVVTGAGDAIYIGNTSGKLYALNRTDGLEIASYQDTSPLATTLTLTGGGQALGVRKDRVVVAYSLGETLKLDWRVIPPRGYARGPAILPDGKWVAVSDVGGVYAYYRDGVPLWETYLQAYVQAPPALTQDGKVLIASRDGKLFTVDADGQEALLCDLGVSVTFPPTIGDDGRIYVSTTDGYVHAISSDGTEKWAYETGTVDLGIGATSVSIGQEGRVYAVGEDGLLYSLTHGGNLRWNFDLEATSDCRPAVDSDENIFVGCVDGTVRAIDKDGYVLWSYTVSPVSPITSPPVIDGNGALYVGTEDGRIIAFKTTAPKVTLTADRTEGLPPLTVQFTATVEEAATYDCVWDFGDGSPTETNSGVTATSVTKTHTYGRSGGFWCSVEVTDEEGETTEANITISVLGGPLASPWPRFGRDAMNTGVARGAGPVLGKELWTRNLGFSASALVLGPEKTIYVVGPWNIAALDWSAWQSPGDTVDGLWWGNTGISGAPSVPALATGERIYWAAGNRLIAWPTPQMGNSVQQDWAALIGGHWGSSPTIAPDGTIYVGGDAAVKRVKADGTVLDTFAVAGGDAVYASPCIAETQTEGAVLVFAHENGRACGVRLSDPSDELWDEALPTGGVTVSPAAYGSGDEAMVVFGSNDGGHGYLYGVRAFDGATSAPDGWSVDLGANSSVTGDIAIGWGGQAIFGGTYGGDNAVICVDAAADSPAFKWAFTDADLGQVKVHPAVDMAGRVYVPDQDRRLFAINVHDGSEAWRHAWTIPVAPSAPAIDDEGVLFVARGMKLHTFYARPPSVLLAVDPTYWTDAPFQATFTASATPGDPQGTIDLYEWDWEYDGTFAADESTPTNVHTHEYVTEADYTAAVQVTDSDGLKALAVAVILKDLPPAADIVAEAEEPVPGLPRNRDPEEPFKFTFDGSASADEDGTIDSWELDYGDGTTPLTGTGAPPSEVFHAYPDLGPTETYAEYTASLTVTDSQTLQDTAYAVVECGTPPVVPTYTTPNLVSPIPPRAAVLTTMTSPALLVGTKWSGCTIDPTEVGDVNAPVFSPVDGSGDVVSCASWHALAGLTKWEWDEEEAPVERTLKFKQTNSENGYTSDEISVDLEWGRYTVMATDPPPEEEEYPEVYVPVPLDAKGDPVTRYIRVIGGGGLDKDEVGCPPEEPKPLGGNVTWDVEATEQTTSDFTAGELTSGTLDPKNEVPYLLLESTGLGTAKVTVTAPAADGRAGTTIFHFIKLCTVDEDEEVVWLAADAGSYLLNEVYDGESSMDLVDGMAFRFYYDGPNMDEERSIELTGGDGIEYTFDFPSGEKTTEDRVILYDDAHEDLAGGCESFFDGEDIVLVHNQGWLPAPLDELYYGLLVGDLGCSYTASFVEWVRVISHVIKLEAFKRPVGVHSVKPGSAYMSRTGIRYFWHEDFRHTEALAPTLKAHVEVQFGEMDQTYMNEAIRCRIRWYQVVQRVQTAPIFRGVYRFYDRWDLPDTYTAGEPYRDRKTNRDVVPEGSFLDPHNENRLTSEYCAQWTPERPPRQVSRTLFMEDQPKFSVPPAPLVPALDGLHRKAWFDTYLVITEPVGTDVVDGIAALDPILTFSWGFVGLELLRFENRWLPGGYLYTWLSETYYDLPEFDLVTVGELIDVYEPPVNGFRTWDPETVARGTANDASKKDMDDIKKRSYR